MPTLEHISFDEYLNTTYHPDCEFIDGELRQRNVGTWPHARLLFLISARLGANEFDWNFIGCMSQRMRVSPTRIRIADLIVLRPGPQPDIITQPPLLVIEVLSPGDTYSELQDRCRDYQNMGVENIWIIDRKTRTGRMCLGAIWFETQRLEIAETPIHIDLADIFRKLDASSIGD